MENIRLIDLPLRKDVYDEIMQNLTPVGVGLANHYMQKELIAEGKRIAEYLGDLESINAVKCDVHYISVKEFLEKLRDNYSSAIINDDSIRQPYFTVYESDEALNCLKKDYGILEKLLKQELL